MSPRWIRLSLLAAGAVAIALLALLRIPTGKPAAVEDLPVVGAVPAFTLQAHTGREVSASDLRGRSWVASFIFTRCALSCPRMVSAMKQVRSKVQVRMVAVTVDPDHDTVEVLADYAAAHQVTAPDWLFLTGDRDSVRRLSVDGFKLGLDDSPQAAAASAEEPIIHSTRLVLVDRQLRIRGYYDPFHAGEIERLVADVVRVDGGAAAAEGREDV